MNDKPPAPTVSHILGEMTWLLTQSPLHRALPIEALEWMVMPALATRQFYIFRDEERPIGLALWAKTDAAGEAKLDRGMLEPDNRLSMAEWQDGDRLWLVDLIAPFANVDNKHREIMIADLIAGPLAGQAFRFHRTDPATGERSVQEVSSDTSERIKSVVRDALDPQTGRESKP